jgi:large exoprotein involved in heme utilization and adhesion
LLNRGGGIEASAFNFSSGNAGNIRIVASEAIEMVGRPFEWWGGVYSRAQGSGDAGSISLSAPRVVLDDHRVQTTAYYQANGGRIDVEANELLLRNGGQIDARTLDGSIGAAGSVDIRARDRIEISGASPIDAAFSGINTETGGAGSSGGIRIRTDELTVDRGFVRSTAGGAGKAGDIDIAARTVSLASGGRIDASTLPGSSGSGGAITIAATDSIRVAGIDRSPLMATRALSPGPESVNQRGRLQGLLPSTITTSTAGLGDGGFIGLTAPRIEVMEGARVEATSTGIGNAGSVNIAASDALRIFGGTISSEALNADGGNIDIRVGNLVHLKRGEITTAVGSGAGAGGNIFIDPTFVILENSKIAANAFGGSGGNIRIIATYFLNTLDTLVDASSQLGVPGTVQISSPNTNLSTQLKVLPAAFFDATQLVREACAGRGVASGSGGSSLVGVGRGGLAASPERLATSTYFGDAPSAVSSAPTATGLKLTSATRARLAVDCTG